MNSFAPVPIDIVHLPAFEGKKSRMGGFSMNKIPSTVVLDDNGSGIVDDDGETVFDLPPLVSHRLIVIRDLQLSELTIRIKMIR